MAEQENSIVIREAIHSDLPSLTTVVPRSFHPVNPFIEACFPDTPLIREYWTRVFGDETVSEKCHLLTAFDSSTNTAVGVLCLRLLQSEDRGAGIWTEYPLCDDTPKATLQPAIDSQVEYRERIFLGKGQPHFLLELFGVDHAYKGRGLERLLLQRAGEIADNRGVATFVEANGYATGFYAKLGYIVQGMVEMPGSIKHEEYLMVRPAAKK